MSLLKNVRTVMFPDTCKACDNVLLRNEDVICTACEYHLPKTGFHLQSENEIAKIFWGKIHLHAATAIYFFDKGEKIQRLLHQLKYNGEEKVGTKLGKLLSVEIMHAQLFNDVSVIIPVPLHKNKIRLRGYNQSELIANGMKDVWNIPVAADLLLRKVATTTQTHKSRFERFQNVDNVFEIKNKENFVGKHVLLIDDVITTGSTIAACASAFLGIDNCRVSVAAIAFAHS